jgi:hypothetical protein
VDRDAVAAPCDNAPGQTNPSQSDLDADGFGDVIDLCPTIAGTNNTADSDSDGVGNACDSCRQPIMQYNDGDPGVTIDAYMLVRNIPVQDDRDQDGIGDACDNCVQLANCEDFGPDHPYVVGDPISFDDPNVCQRDDDQDMIGDACAGMQLDGAAGPVGFAPTDDFDQDGLTNAVDACVRLPVPEAVPCSGDDECPVTAHCEPTMGLCDHADADEDGVGDACDTCAFVANIQQIMDGGAQEDDADGDFVGAACEAATTDFPSPLPMAFWSPSASGRCCTTLLVEDEAGNLFAALDGMPLLDPDGLPIRVDCSDPGCRALPDEVAQTPGVLTLPPGCDGVAGENTATDPDFFGDLALLWQTRCALPQLDQDFDGLGDEVDLCPFMFDPTNAQYVDDGGMLWPTDGKYCNGAYSPDAICGG